MKNILITIIVLVTTLIAKAQIVSEKIGDNSTIIVPSAVLEIESTTKGFLPPRMTYIQRNAIVNPTAGLIIRCTNCGTYGELQLYNGSVWTNLYGEPVQNPWNEVQSSITGRYWMDRNLGASQVATSSTDALAFGDLFQWGRSADGHQKRSNTHFTNIQSNSESPSNDFFITTSSSPNNWLLSGNNNLWQGVNGVNNPCPAGFQIPTNAEWNSESQSLTNSVSAFSSFLKLTLAGYRVNNTFNISLNIGDYWSSSINGTSSGYLTFNSNVLLLSFFSRSNGLSVRCIKNP
jgi:Fibrobacter succinogenes major domain (Fib_succ_major)